MPPSLALIVWLILTVALLWFDPAKDSRISSALWVPLIAMLILASRSPSQWLSGNVGLAAQSLEEGNPLDRVISLGLILLAIGILMSRSFRWGAFFTRNMGLMALLGFSLVSVVWSDFPLVALKRWFRDFGNYLVILVVLTDAFPLEAVRSILRRISYLLIPLSIVLNKYYPLVSKKYDIWTGVGDYVGATTSKNMLGVLCLVSGLFFFWDTATRWSGRKQRRTRQIILLNIAFFSMTLWVLHVSESTTSTVCLALGCAVVWAAHRRVFRRHPMLLKVLIPSLFLIYLILDFGLDMNGSMASAVGKDPTLTDRTKIWAFVLGMHTNPIIGTGYQSFWLGPRLEYFWRNSGLGHLNEAHNGYLEIYLDLGLSGVFLIVLFLMDSYRTICRKLDSSSSLGTLGLALWMALVFYNMSEAAFQIGLLYSVFMLAAITLPGRVKVRVRSTAVIETATTVEFLPKPPLETADVRTAKWSAL
jgi:exopolysaccharide production protein ExoQ